MNDRSPTDVNYEFHRMGYQPPVEQICKNIEVKLEGDVYKKVIYYGVHVDKEELMKALKYDRDQYKKGFFDGLAAQRKSGRWIEDEYGIPHCSECGTINNTVYKNYCPNCGADMRGGENG